jgi:D-sedoheptulose 7-phosphate isomerase
MDARLRQIAGYLDAAIALQHQIADSCADQIAAASDVMATTFKAGNKVLLCGNGGSAADCQHMAAELVSRLSREVERPGLPALALTTDTSFLTAYGNDFGFGGVFERQVEALGCTGDALVAISTSGKSENVRRAVQAAKVKGIATIGLMGEGGSLALEVDYAIVVPSRNTQHIQEALLPVEHLLCLLVEEALFGHLGPGATQ